MKYTVEEFAGEIRKLYPGDYDDLNDETLVELWLKKYPTDRVKILIPSSGSTTEPKLAPCTEPAAEPLYVPSTETIKSNQGYSKMIMLIVVLSIIGGGIFLLIKNTNIGSENSEYISDNNTAYVNSDNTLNDFNNIQIDPNISDMVDSSAVVTQLNLDEDLKTKIKRILSDPNPDPENKVGSVCDRFMLKCKWCGTEYETFSTYTSIQSNIKSMLSPAYLYGLTLTLIYDKMLGTNSVNDKITELLNANCVLYEQGTKYDCESQQSEFCSEKCKTEYSYSHN